MTEQVVKTFGGKYEDPAASLSSFNLLEDFISREVKDWATPPDTPALVAKFSDQLRNMQNEDFAFLLLHSGYIPESYDHDSSQETLYSKLIECLVKEWALRIGFTESYLQTQKSSKEDVTIQIGDKVIVTDAKSFRLGRSQAAPNVKDTIKKADYEKWLDAYEPDRRLGGLIAFPSLHTWAKTSDVFSYISDKDRPIMLLFYEQMAFMLLHGITHNQICEVLSSYAEIHPNTTKKSEEYFQRKLTALFGENNQQWVEFEQMAKSIVKQMVDHTIGKLESHVGATRAAVTEEVQGLNEEQLRAALIESQIKVRAGQAQKNLVNIKKFRPHSS